MIKNIVENQQPLLLALIIHEYKAATNARIFNHQYTEGVICVYFKNMLAQKKTLISWVKWICLVFQRKTTLPVCRMQAGFTNPTLSEFKHIRAFVALIFFLLL